MRNFMKLTASGILAAALSACGGATTPEPATSNTAADANVPAAEVTAPTPTPVAATDTPAPPPAFAQCASCHSARPGQNGVGPSLAGVFGTKAAEVAGYNFSSAMQGSGLTWDEATLDRYLKSPRQVVPGTKMTFVGIADDTKRAAVIAYLKAIG
ncbi:c-type cytochrome [Hephaestia sp. GCM10023244]|uniref:c-type cytochrome n=1 Tax=unclassified Hephaestia TaxID=2631281 RepID=UPI002076E08A|nr:c-type cytochrome [Hephaestia sp. MAHUQ-44]MCM8729784.1 c-type cytochrome [Hephaestia sp. MAHUQ-44]